MYVTDLMISRLVRQVTTTLLLLMALVDVGYPGLCHEGNPDMDCAGALPSAWAAELSSEDSTRSCASSTHVDHCFCCCRHVLVAASPHFDSAVSRPAIPLERQMLLPPGNAALVFHPPRLA